MQWWTIQRIVKTETKNRWQVFNIQAAVVSIRNIFTGYVWVYPVVPELTNTQNGKWCRCKPLSAVVSLGSKTA
jgi:hypothetical protein